MAETLRKGRGRGNRTLEGAPTGILEILKKVFSEGGDDALSDVVRRRFLGSSDDTLPKR